jgi:hypothetical protein
MSESQEQAAYIEWFRLTYPREALSLRVSQSGGYKGKGRQGAIRMSKIKAQGGVTGESDIAILLPRGGSGCMLIEFKTKTGKATQAQLDYIDYHNEIGNTGVICYGLDAAMTATVAYLEQ